jgi:dipeptidyl aminopeptidase/acylaminoacyl peptidase
VKLTDETMRDLDLAPDGRWAVGRDTRGYIHDFKRAAADLYRVNTTTGERTLILKGHVTASGGVAGFSPDGTHLLLWKDARFHAYHLDTATLKPLAGTAVNFTDLEFDRPGPKPAYGIAGYASDGKSVIAQHRYDLWQVPLDGSAPKNLTNGQGQKGEVRFRYVRTEPVDPLEGPAPGGGGRGGGAGRQTIDLAKPITLSAYGEYTKKAGFYELANGQMREIVYEDASFSTPTRAAKADVFLFTRQSFVEYPDLRVSGPDFKTSKKITDVNPQQAEFKWGRRILFDYKNKAGVRLQGILAIPDDYQPGEKRPMIVTFYEKNSQNLHRYNAPSFLTGMGGSPMQAVSEGYLTMLPDVHFNTGSSHSDMLDCVEAAVKKVIEMGYVDPKRIAVTGHSYGGEGAAFIGTRSKLFAAVGVGAGVSDLYSDFVQSWGWSYQVSGGSGANAFDYYLYGQGRWGFSPWDNPEVYRFESALTHVKEATAPFLIMHGTADPTVSFIEGLNLYSGLRYHGKTAVLLAYPGEGHGLRGFANRKDLTVRFFEFFNHYLKGAPAPKWLTDGVPFIDKDQGRY